jgi:hypothetical protein
LFDDIAACQLEPPAACWAQHWQGHSQAGRSPCGFEIGPVVRAHHEVHSFQHMPTVIMPSFPQRTLRTESGRRGFSRSASSGDGATQPCIAGALAIEPSSAALSAQAVVSSRSFQA